MKTREELIQAKLDELNRQVGYPRSRDEDWARRARVGYQVARLLWGVEHMVHVYEVVRDDGDDSVGWGHSFTYLLLDWYGNFWQCSLERDKSLRWVGEPVVGKHPRDRADLKAVRSFIASGTYEGDRFHLLYVREVL